MTNAHMVPSRKDGLDLALAAAMVLVLTGAPTVADVFSGKGAVHAGLTGGGTVGLNRDWAEGEFTTTVSFDWDAPNMVFGESCIQTPAFHSTGSKTFTVGPGQVKTIDVAIWADSIRLCAGAVGPVSLTPSTLGYYDVDDPTGLNNGEYGSFQGTAILACRYEIAGPTETAQGSFDPAELRLHPGYDMRFYKFTHVSTSGYPDQVVLTNPWSEWGEIGLALSEPRQVRHTVDGIDVTVSLGHVELRLAENVTLVPEPATLALLALGGLALLRRKR